MIGIRSGLAAGKRAIVPADCVTVRSLLRNDSYVPSIQISPDDSQVAYLVKAPNLATNQNDIELFVVPLSARAPEHPTLLLRGEDVSQLHWSGDSRRLFLLMRVARHVAIVEVDIRNGARTVLARAAANITEYSMDRAERTVAFATEARQSAGPAVSAREAADGYRIEFQGPARSLFKRRQLFLTRRQADGAWTTPQPVDLHSPISHTRLAMLQCQLNLALSLSPDGHLLLLQYIDSSGYPDSWRTDGYVQTVIKDGFPGAPVLALYDLESKTTSMPMRTPWPWSLPLWSLDSRSFLLNAQSPIGDDWNHCVESARDPDCGSPHLFQVRPEMGQQESGRIEEIASHVADITEQPLFWSASGEVVVHTSAGTLTTFREQNGVWSPTRTLRIPLDNPYRYSQLATDGRLVIGDYENATTPPEIFEYRDGDRKTITLRRLNPQFDALQIAPMKRTTWATATGYKVDGFLFTPPDYVAGRAYPLVIQTKPDAGSFVCDSGDNHDPSFAPQPIADAGMMYLIRTYPEDYNPAAERQHYPRGYPGGIGEAAFQMDLWESAVHTLAEQGLVDPKRVGIIGFSRSGWYTEFILTHSHIRYKAATIADNVHYSLGEYWLLHTESVIRGYDTMYGGPPYGDSLHNWEQYSVSFNLSRIHTPLLMEVMGKGNSFDHPHEIPDNLALSFEIFAGLRRMGKPAQLYYYPNEAHQPDHPRARLMSLERNLDWYKFWLLDSAKSTPEGGN